MNRTVSAKSRQLDTFDDGDLTFAQLIAAILLYRWLALPRDTAGPSPDKTSTLASALPALKLNRDKHKFGTNIFIGRSDPFRRMLSQAQECAPYPSTDVLLIAPRGTEKQTLASAICEDSSRAEHRLGIYRCGEGAEAEVSALFGIATGDETREQRYTPGLLEKLSLGTVFLDDLHEAAPTTQERLANLLLRREVRPAKAHHAHMLDGSERTRIIAAVPPDIHTRAELRDFHPALYHALVTTAIAIPSLAERGREDVLLLARWYVEMSLRARGVRSLSGYHVDEQFIEQLTELEWHRANVDQLRGTIESLVQNCGEKPILRGRALRDAYERSIPTVETTRDADGERYSFSYSLPLPCKLKVLTKALSDRVKDQALELAKTDDPDKPYDLQAAAHFANVSYARIWQHHQRRAGND